MAVVAPLALLLQFDVPPPASLEDIGPKVPQRIGEWVAIDERPPSKQEVEILETEAILTRTYSRGAPPDVDLSLVFAQDNRRVAHPPEICYKGAGWTVESNQVTEFPVEERSFYANRLLLVRGGKRMLVVYWFKAGPYYCASYLRMQWNIVRLHLTRRGSSSALVRVSAMSSGPEEDEQIVATLCEFAAVAIPAMRPALE